MPDGVHSARQRDTLLRLPIGELSEWHLVVRCAGCRAERYLMVRDLVARYGAAKTLVLLLPRLRCAGESCGRPAESVRLRNKFPVHPGPALVDVVIMGR